MSSVCLKFKSLPATIHWLSVLLRMIHRYALASAISVTFAPARRSAVVAFASVAPVVVTSSIRNTCASHISDLSDTKAPATFERRSERERRVCGCVGRDLTSAFGANVVSEPL